MHHLIIGMTECGKTTLAKLICKQLKKQGKKTAVLDPLYDEGWNADFQTQSPEEFLEWAKSNRSTYLFVDEGSISIGRYNAPMQWLATMARHWGHSCYFICQGLTQLPPMVRNNCRIIYLFTASDGVNKVAAEEFNKRELRSAESLGKGDFIKSSRFGKSENFSIDFSKGIVIKRTASKVSLVSPSKDENAMAIDDNK